MVSVLIPTLNEQANLDDCLASVSWSNDVVVVDSGSSDGTVELSERKGATVVQFHWKPQLPKKKNWALENVAWKNEWVLIVDADERITPELAIEIQSAVRYPKADGYLINRRFMFLGRWLKHCGYYPSWNLRLFRHRLGRYEKLQLGDTGSGDNEIHEHVVMNGRVGYLHKEMLHFAYPDIHTWVAKHNRYSNWEAAVETQRQGVTVGVSQLLPQARTASGDRPGIGGQLAARRRLREWSRQMPFRPTLRFLYSYILKRGFLDGYEGYVFCRLLATYELLSVLKAYELRRKPR